MLNTDQLTKQSLQYVFIEIKYIFEHLFESLIVSYAYKLPDIYNIFSLFKKEIIWRTIINNNYNSIYYELYLYYE